MSVLLAPIAVAGCDSNPSGPSSGAPFTVTDIVVGDGEEAVNGRTLVVHFTGWLYDPNAPDNRGAVFDSTEGRQPFSFVLGSGLVIQGWEQGLLGMRVGGVRELIIPPELGFGDQATGSIPPNSTLIFEVELINVL